MSYGGKTNCIYVNTATKTITNTTSEISQFPTGIGSATVKAKSVAAGDTIEIRTNVRLTTGVSQQSTFRVYVDGVTISSVGTLPNNLTNDQADFLFTIRVLSAGTNGQIQVDGRTLINGGTGINQVSMRAFPYQAPITINTDIDWNIDITYQWTEAHTDNILLIEQASIHFNKM